MDIPTLPLEHHERRISIPIKIFHENPDLTPLEAIVLHLNEMGHKHHEIALILNRDQRNIWTICDRAKKKVKK